MQSLIGRFLRIGNRFWGCHRLHHVHVDSLARTRPSDLEQAADRAMRHARNMGSARKALAKIGRVLARELENDGKDSSGVLAFLHSISGGCEPATAPAILWPELRVSLQRIGATRNAKPAALIRKPRKRRRSLVGKPLTPKQREAVEVVGRCKGNISEAARVMQRDAKTVRQHYEAGMAKLGEAITKPKAPKTRRLSHDRRGQADIAEGDDRRR